MSRSRILSSIAAASLGIALLGACSAESLTERAVGFGLEQAIEGDQDIDLDFSDEGGGFSISTEEGDFALNFDDDSGGIVFNTDEGEGVISFDEDAGSITFDTDEGSGQINVDEDAGTVTFETEDGQVGIFGGSDVPANWPAAVGFPATMVAGSETFSTIDMGEQGMLISGTFTHDKNDPYASNAVAALQADGFTGSVTNDGADGEIFAFLSRDGQSAQVMASPGSTTVSVMVQP